jgi:uncharacterized membrane protein
MSTLLAACLAFLVTHVGISSTPLRKILLDLIGANGYRGVYSLLAFITFGSMIYAYSNVPHTDFIWLPDETAFKVTRVLMLLSVVLIVLGTMAKNPTSIMTEDAIDEEWTGVLKITRHPVQWAIMLWVTGHLISNGDTASVIFFGTFGLVSLLGTITMDIRKRAEANPRWKTFYATTSNVPFAALIAGKTHFRASDITYQALIIGLVLYGVIYWFHQWVSGGARLF